MAQRGVRSVSELDVLEGGFTPWERAGQLALASEPKAFAFSELEEKYPTRDTRPRIPAYIQRQLDDQELERKAAELEVRRREAQMNIYDSQLNQEREMMTQVPLARKALANLNPADDDFIVKLSEVQNQAPLAFENQQFSQYLVAPLIRRHEMIQQNNMIIRRGTKPQQQMERQVTEDDFQKAAALLSDKSIQSILEDDKKIQTPQGQIAVMRANVARETMNRFMQQRGGGIPAEDEIAPTTIQEPNVYNFSSVEEVEASGLPSGTIVYINGRKARID